MNEESSKSRLSSFMSLFGKAAAVPDSFLSVVQILYRLAEMEEEAAAYYEGLARYTDLEWVRGFASQVAVVEKSHQQSFLERARALGGSALEFSDAQEMPEDVRTLMASSIIPRTGNIEKTAVYYGEKDAIEFAIQAEVNTIHLLMRLREYVPASEHDVLNQVLQEEVGHKTALEALHQKYFPAGATPS